MELIHGYVHEFQQLLNLLKAYPSIFVFICSHKQIRDPSEWKDWSRKIIPFVDIHIQINLGTYKMTVPLLNKSKRVVDVYKKDTGQVFHTHPCFAGYLWASAFPESKPEPPQVMRPQDPDSHGGHEKPVWSSILEGIHLACWGTLQTDGPPALPPHHLQRLGE